MPRPSGGRHLPFRQRRELHCGKPALERGQVTAEWYPHLGHSECLAPQSLPRLIYRRCCNRRSLQSLRTNNGLVAGPAVCHQSVRSVVLNLPADMRGPDLEAIRERIRHKCDHVCRHKQTKLISGTGREPTGPCSRGTRALPPPPIPGGAELIACLREPGFEDEAHSWYLEGY